MTTDFLDWITIKTTNFQPQTSHVIVFCMFVSSYEDSFAVWTSISQNFTVLGPTYKFFTSKNFALVSYISTILILNNFINFQTTEKDITYYQKNKTLLTYQTSYGLWQSGWRIWHKGWQTSSDMVCQHI